MSAAARRRCRCTALRFRCVIGAFSHQSDHVQACEHEHGMPLVSRLVFAVLRCGDLVDTCPVFSRLSNPAQGLLAPLLELGWRILDPAMAFGLAPQWVGTGPLLATLGIQLFVSRFLDEFLTAADEV